VQGCKATDLYAAQDIAFSVRQGLALLTSDDLSNVGLGMVVMGKRPRWHIRDGSSDLVLLEQMLELEHEALARDDRCLAPRGKSLIVDYENG
jgi:hypothetical protein